MPCLTGIIFFWVRFRRWNVNKSIRARSWGLQLPLPTIKRLFMLPWRAIPVTLAHWRELQIIILLHSASFCHSSSSSLCCFSSPWTLAWSPPSTLSVAPHFFPLKHVDTQLSSVLTPLLLFNLQTQNVSLVKVVWQKVLNFFFFYVKWLITRTWIMNKKTINTDSCWIFFKLNINCHSQSEGEI